MILAPSATASTGAPGSPSAATPTARPVTYPADTADATLISGWSDHLYINEWYTTAIWDGNYFCTHSRWYLPRNTQIRVGNGVCGGAEAFFSDWYPEEVVQPRTGLQHLGLHSRQALRVGL